MTNTIAINISFFSIFTLKSEVIRNYAERNNITEAEALNKLTRVYAINQFIDQLDHQLPP